MNNALNMFYYFSATGYDCATNNPCSQGDGYYENTDPAKYVQCGANQCHVVSCPGGLVWQQNILSCNWPSPGGGSGTTPGSGGSPGSGSPGGAGMTKPFTNLNYNR